MNYCVWIVSYFIVGVNAYTQCSTLDYAGVVDPESYDDKYDRQVGWGFVVRRPSFVFSCCGVIEKWEVYVKEAGTLELQVWRQDTGSQEKLVGLNVVEATIGTVANELMYTINSTQQVTVVPGDAIGWRTAGTTVLTFNEVSTGDKLVYHDDSMPGVQVGGKHIFPKDDKKDRMYAVKAYLAPGSPPSFQNLPQSVTLSETTFPGFVVFTPIISDVNPYDTHNFTYAGSWPSYFDMNINTGVVKVAKELLPATFRLYVVVTDVCGLQDIQQLTITVTGINHAPKLENMPGIAHVHEDTETEVLLYNLTVTDSDPVQCFLTETEQDNAQFLLKVTNVISEFSIYLRAGANLSYSDQSTFELNVTCTDGLLWSSDIIYVYIKVNTPPVFLNIPGNTSVSAKTSSTGTHFFIVAASDDDDDNLIFTMSCMMPQCPFNMSIGGYLYPTASLRDNKIGIYDITVSVTDGKHVTGPTPLTIIVEDRNNPPVITSWTKTLYVSEHTTPMTSLLTISVTDIDAQDSIACSMDVQPTSGLSIFSFDSQSFTLYLEQNAVIDYELLTVTSFNVSFVATDFIDVTSFSVLITIIDDNDPPQFLSDTVYVQIGESPALSYVGHIPSYTDQDVNDNAEFSILGGSGSGYIAVNSTTGYLYFKMDYDIDRASFPSQIELQIEIKDGGGLRDNCSLIITINDINDNKPIFNATHYVFKVSSNANSGTTLGTVHAEDLDSGLNALITYNVQTSTNITEKLLLSNNGDIISLVPMSEFQGQVSITFVVVATDSGIPSHSSSVNVTIVIVSPESFPNSSFNTVLAVATGTGSSPTLTETSEWRVLVAVSGVSLLLLLLTVACQIHQARRRSDKNNKEQTEHHRLQRQITPKPLSNLHRMKSSTLLLKDTDFWKQNNERRSSATLSRTFSSKQFTPTAPMSTNNLQSNLLRSVSTKENDTFPRIIKVDGAQEYGNRQLSKDRTALRF